MADDADVTKRDLDFLGEVALKNQLARTAEHDARFDGSHCVDCGEEVEPERLRIELVHCSDCAYFNERAAAARGRNGR